jgi:hypothetical protein
MKRTRLASLLLLLASPALGGTLLPVLHPCPVDAPWTLAGGDHADHGNHHPAPAQAPEGTLTIVPASIAHPQPRAGRGTRSPARAIGRVSGAAGAGRSRCQPDSGADGGTPPSRNRTTAGLTLR